MDELEKLLKIAAEYGYAVSTFKCSGFEVDLRPAVQPVQDEQPGKIDFSQMEFYDEDGNVVDPDDYDLLADPDDLN